LTALRLKPSKIITNSFGSASPKTNGFKQGSRILSKEKLRALLNSALPRLRPKTSGFKQGRQLRYLSMFGVCSVPSSVLPSNYPQVAQLPALLKTIGFKRGGTEFSKAHSFALLNMQLPCLKPLVLGEALPKLCFIFRTACPH